MKRLRKLIETIIKEDVQGWSTKVKPTESGTFKIQLFNLGNLFDEREINSKAEIPNAIHDMMGGDPDETPLPLVRKKEDTPIPLSRRKLN